MPGKQHFYQSTEESPLLLSDEVFQNGITFNVKMIGSMDIPRPMSRIEIVAAMRRVRLEFKSKGVKKRKVALTVGVNGVKSALRIKKKKKHHLKYRNNGQADEIVLQQHPIYRIFYVSHDSQDVKVFSYIARETSSNVFHCCVFKASKKSQAQQQQLQAHQQYAAAKSQQSQQQQQQQSHSNSKSQSQQQGNGSSRQQSSQSKSQHQQAASTKSRKSMQLDGPPPQHRGSGKFFQLFQSQEPQESASSKLHMNPPSPSSNQQQRKKISFEAQSNTQVQNSHSPPAVSQLPPSSLSVQNAADKQALRIVRTIGQAFEVCHKLNSPGEEEGNGRRTEEDSPNGDSTQSLGCPDNASSSVPLTPQPLLKKSLISSSSSKQRPPPLKNTWAKQGTDSPTDFNSHHHQVQLLKEQLEQEVLNTQSAKGQLNLLREQLSTEMSARIEAENRNKQLLHHNKELLNHLQVLVQHIQELEGRARDFSGGEGGTIGSGASGSPQNPSPSPKTQALKATSSLLLQSSLLELLESQLHRFYSPSLVVGNSHLEGSSTPVQKSVRLPVELLKPPPPLTPTKSSLISRSLTPRSKVERWFVLSSDGPLEETLTKSPEGHRTSTESGFVSQRNLLTTLWERVKLTKKPKIRKRSHRSIATV